MDKDIFYIVPFISKWD